MKNKLNGNTVMFVIGMLALIALLQYNWNHTFHMLANYIRPQEQAAIAALGIEAAVVWLSWRIGKLRKLDIKVFTTIPGIMLVVTIIISMLANLSEGYFVKYNIELTSVTIQTLDWVQLLIAIMSTVMVSGIVFALSEVLSGDSKKLIQKQVENNTEVVPVTKSENDKAKVFEKYVTANPNASYREIIRATGVVKNVASIKPLAESVGWHKNGNGWEKS